MIAAIAGKIAGMIGARLQELDSSWFETTKEIMSALNTSTIAVRMYMRVLLKIIEHKPLYLWLSIVATISDH
jgi:hypothetical protein